MTNDFPDWRPAPNIRRDRELYERENEAIARDGRLDEALMAVRDFTDLTLLDVGTGTGFWLPRYARQAQAVIGVEPDADLCADATRRVAELSNATVLAGSAERLPLDDASVDVAHARFAYFFGEGSEAGLEEVRRVQRPGGSFVVVDNSWLGGDFAWLLRAATEGNAAIDPEATDRWWRARGASRTEVEAAWICPSADELEAILRLEFATDVVDRYLREHGESERLSYHYALFHLMR